MSDMKFRLVVNRTSKKSIMTPEFRSIVELNKDGHLSGTSRYWAVKEINGNIQVTMGPIMSLLKRNPFERKSIRPDLCGKENDLFIQNLFSRAESLGIGSSNFTPRHLKQIPFCICSC